MDGCKLKSQFGFGTSGTFAVAFAITGLLGILSDNCFAASLTKVLITQVRSDYGGTEAITETQTITSKTHGGTWMEITTVDTGNGCTPSATVSGGTVTLKSTTGSTTVTKIWSINMTTKPDTTLFNYSSFNCSTFVKYSDKLTVKYSAVDTTKPSVVINDPTSATTWPTNATAITIKGTAYDKSTLSSMEWSTDKGSSGTTTFTVGVQTTNWTASNIPLSSSGTTKIWILATDIRGNQGSDYINVVYDVTAPNLTITTPTSKLNYQTNEPQITLSGSASDAYGIKTPTWVNNLGGSGSTTYDSNTKIWNASVSLFSGVNEITVTVFDVAGNSKSALIKVTYHKPTALYTFNEGSGNVVGDSSGNNFNGIVTGAEWLGNGFMGFDSFDYVEISILFNKRQTLSLTAWVKLEQASLSGAEVISIGDYVRLRLDGVDGSGGYYFDGTQWLATLSSVRYAGTGWHFFAYVINMTAKTQQLYVDGILVASSAHAAPIVYSGLDLTTLIGCHSSGCGEGVDFIGAMDEIAIYGKALTQWGVSGLFSLGSGLTRP